MAERDPLAEFLRMTNQPRPDSPEPWGPGTPSFSPYASPGHSMFPTNPSNPYQTQLSAADEQTFHQWVQDHKHIPVIGFWQDSPTADYDLRGYWKSTGGQIPTNVNPNDKQVHLPDYFKTPYHESFSAESVYASPDAPTWNEKDQLIDKQGRVVFDERKKVKAQIEAQKEWEKLHRRHLQSNKALSNYQHANDPGESFLDAYGAWAHDRDKFNNLFPEIATYFEKISGIDKAEVQQ